MSEVCGDPILTAGNRRRWWIVAGVLLTGMHIVLRFASRSAMESLAAIGVSWEGLVLAHWAIQLSTYAWIGWYAARRQISAWTLAAVVSLSTLAFWLPDMLYTILFVPPPIEWRPLTQEFIATILIGKTIFELGFALAAFHCSRVLIRPDPGRCVCGYDLRGSPGPRCPECGQPFAAGA